MSNVSEANVQHPAFPYTPAQLRRITVAVRNEGYPPQGRTGVGTVVRKAG
jgi:hypothetical protein